ncbi:hypothetical protein H0W26_00900 [Candidatus Dependentiae bacterium]|nr:hypothetical protein [Candidatus Dependentiae bacterium]
MKKLLLPALVGLFSLASSIGITSSLKGMVKENYFQENCFSMLPLELKQYITSLSLESALNYNFDRSTVLFKAPEAIKSVAFSPDGTTVITGSWDKTARLWDVKTEQQLHALKGHTNVVTSVAYSPDGNTILTGSTDNTARLWNSKTGEPLHILKGHRDQVTSVGFSPEGTTAITGSWDSTARLWDVKTGKELHILKGHTDTIYSLAYSPDGTTIITDHWMD